MSVLIKDMEMPKECHGCRWFYFQGTSCTEPKYYLDARCKMVESGQDWYGKDVHGGWIGESIEHIPGWTGYYQYKHCVEMGTMASQCPLCELPSAQPELCEDAVSRVGAISHFRAIADATCPKEKYNEGFVDGLEFCIAHLSTMPSVTPKQRTGKWIKLDIHRGMADHKCTACEQECYVPTCMGEPLYAFCPNCGSYNGGEQDE